MPNPPNDYKSLYEAFKLQKGRNPDLLLKDWCVAQSLNYTNTSSEFSKVRRELQLATFQKNNIALLLKTQANVTKAVDNPELEAEFQAKFNLEAFKAVADRAGFSPQAVNINMQQLNQTRIEIPPLFASVEMANLNTMLGEGE